MGKTRARIGSALAVAAIGMVVASPPAGVAKNRRPSPGRSTAAFVAVHNSFASGVFDSFVGPTSSYETELEQCHEVEASGGEVRAIGEEHLREQAAANIKNVDEVYVVFNRDLPRWATLVEGFKVALPKSAHAKLSAAVANLRAAHTAHEEEFFDMRGVWVDMEAVNCAGMEELERKETEIGTHAWIKEYKALHALAQLFHVKKPTVEYPVGPYIE
jgi:hypothetical protein